MEPGSQGFRFGAGGETVVHPAIACAVLVAAILIFFRPRKYVIAPLLAAAFLIPMDQVVVIGPFHFMMLRILILLGWVKLFWTKLSSHCELPSGGMNGIDKAVVLYVGSSVVAFTLLWGEWGALINHLGLCYTVFGIYFMLRFFIRDQEDVERTIRVLAYIAAIIALIMVIEQATGQNPYAMFGGGRQAVRMTLLERGNQFRAMGSFQHPILAGTFGATLLPLFVGLWWSHRKNLGSALVGVLASTVIVMASVSSTPLIAYLAGIVALCFWPLRDRMRPIRWGIVIVLISLHLVMKAPVWALIGRTNVIGGSSGYHRYMLVDQFIRRFGDWWLLGTKTNAEWSWGMWDVANQYVGVGQDAGLFPFLFFVAAIVFGFKYLGIASKTSRGNRKRERFFWVLGAALFSHVVAFFGISYFDQTMVAWYALLAIISATAAPLKGAMVTTRELPNPRLVSSPASTLGPSRAGCFTNMRGSSIIPEPRYYSKSDVRDQCGSSPVEPV